ncbi:MAG: class I SAM-dependent methyltransferase [Flavobacteriales bacterium]|nr:class I SAM-dependent methyltransferase [Flavobacteriales bacterium]
MSSSSTHNQPWYETWFKSPYYHVLYRDRDQREARLFITKLLRYLAPISESHFLDLACGQGRHSLIICDAGFEVTGIDLARENINIARKNANEKLHFSQHDMREPLGKELFEYVLNLFTSFGYFEKLEENEEVIKTVVHALKKGGKFVLDFMNVETVVKGLIPEEHKDIDGIHFKIQRSHQDGFILKRINIKDGHFVYNFNESVKALTKKDLMDMFDRNGLEVLDMFGNYSLDKFDSERSPRLILIGKKT